MFVLGGLPENIKELTEGLTNELVVEGGSDECLEVGDSYFGTVNNDLAGKQVFWILGEMPFEKVLFILMKIVLDAHFDKRGNSLGADADFGALLHVFVEYFCCKGIAFIVN